MRQLAEKHPEKLRELLCERLAFERLASRVYMAAILKLERATDVPQVADLVLRLRAHREQETEHAGWIEERLRELAYDPSCAEQGALEAALEAHGICAVILSPDESLTRTFHALVGLELLDAAGWRDLVELADAAGAEDARLVLRLRLWAEEEHADLARAIVTTLAAVELEAESGLSRAA